MEYRKDLVYGELLKKIRKSLGFRQYEIVGNEITRNLVSQIENAKTPLNKKTAKLLIDNMNRLAKERNLEIILDESDLTIPGMFEAKQIADDYIKTLNKDLNLEQFDAEKYIDEINIFLSKWDLPEKKVIIYAAIADYYYSKTELHQSYVYYVKSFESTIKLLDNIQLIKIVIKIMHLCIRLGKYKEAIVYSNIVNVHKANIPENLFDSIIYNKALAYKYLAQYDLCIDEITKLEDIINENDLSKYVDVMTLKAICFKYKKMHNKALEIYIILNSKVTVDQLEKKLMILLNILEIHCTLRNNLKVTEYLNTIVPLLNTVDIKSIYLSQFNLEIGMAYKYLGDYDLSEKYLSDALIYAQDIKDLDTIEGSINNLTDIYISKQSKSIDKLKNKIFSLVTNNLLKPDNQSILQIISFYNQARESEKVDEVINFLLNIKRRS